MFWDQETCSNLTITANKLSKRRVSYRAPDRRSNSFDRAVERFLKAVVWRWGWLLDKITPKVPLDEPEKEFL